MKDYMKDLIEALNILSKYRTPDCHPTICTDAELYVCVDYTKISEEDLARLKELGFVPDKDSGYMVSYRFGS